MRPKSMILIVIALGCGLVASIGISQMIEGRGGAAPEAEKVQIIIAKANIATGDPIKAEMVELKDWPQDTVPEGAFTSFEELEGQRPRHQIVAGTPILEGNLMDGTGKSTAERIPAGYSVIAVKVDADTAVANLLNPGDRVDVMVFLRRSGEIQRTVTQTILRYVKVFAVNDAVDMTDEGENKTIKAKTVSLLVTPKQAQKLSLATSLGKIHLAMRRPDDKPDEHEIDATAADDILDDVETGDPKEELASTPKPAMATTAGGKSAPPLLDFLKGARDEPQAEPKQLEPAKVAMKAPAKPKKVERMTIIERDQVRVFERIEGEDMFHEVTGQTAPVSDGPAAGVPVSAPAGPPTIAPPPTAPAGSSTKDDPQDTQTPVGPEDDPDT